MSDSFDNSSYKEFEAVELFCANCKKAVPVRKRLLIVLPDGEKFDYLCKYCGTSVGSKLIPRSKNLQLII